MVIKLVTNFIKAISSEVSAPAEQSSKIDEASPSTLSNFEYNKQIWNGYAKWWTKEGLNAEDPSLNEDKVGRVNHLGDEWGILKDVDRIVEEYINAYVTPDSVVAEIGSGGGRIASRVAAGCKQFHCFDIASEMLNKAKAALNQYQHVQYVLLDGCRLGSEYDNKFDFVYAFDVFVHLDLHNIWKYFQSISRVLKPGGKAFVHTANLKAPGGWARFAQQESYAVEGHYFLCPEMIDILAYRSDLKVLKRSIPDETNFYLNRDYLAILQK